MPLLGLPIGAIDAVMPQQPAQPFMWGAGGARLLTQDVERMRQRAEAQMAAGADYSPIGSWTQGLARVSQALLGAMEEKRANKAAEANAAHSDAITQALLGGDNGAVTAAMTDPTVSPEVQKLATMQWKINHPDPVAPSSDEKLLAAAGYVPGTPEYQAQARRMIVSKGDPFITASLPGGRFYAGPQSGFMTAVTGGGGPVSTAGGSPTIVQQLPPGAVPIDAGGPTPSASGGFP